LEIALLGAAISKGQPLKGVECGPDILRQNGLIEVIKKFNGCLSDYGNFSEESDGCTYEALYLRALECFQGKDLSVLVGGDHSVAFSSISAMLKFYPDMGVIWVDAHGDINTPMSSPSGNLHGMPLASLLGLEPKMPWMKNFLNPKKLVYVGVRDLDPGEEDLIKDLGIKTFDIDDVYELGMTRVYSEALNHIDPKKETPIHISFDLDAVDPGLTSATGLPVPHGLNETHLKELEEGICQTNHLVSLEVVELNHLQAKSQIDLDRAINICLGVVKSAVESHAQSFVGNNFMRIGETQNPRLFQ
jgi:arginase